MLVVKRKLNETITIGPVDGLDPDMALSEAFKDGAIEITLMHIAGRQARIGIEAPYQLRISRGDREKSSAALSTGDNADPSTDEPDAPPGILES